MTTVNITGLGPVVVNGYVTSTSGYDPNNPSAAPLTTYEYVSSSLATQYSTDMQVLQVLLTKSPITTTDYQALLTASSNLLSLALNGVNNDPLFPGRTYYMTASMAYNLGPIMQSLKAVGITANNGVTDPTAQINLVKEWQALSSLGISTAVTNALNATSNASNSLQSMIELEYVKQGNDYIFQNLGNLEAALSTTQGIVNNLTVIQNIINEVTVSNKGNFKFPPDNSSQIPSAAVTGISNATQMNLSNEGAIPNITVTIPLSFLLSSAGKSKFFTNTEAQTIYNSISGNHSSYLVSAFNAIITNPSNPYYNTLIAKINNDNTVYDNNNVAYHASNPIPTTAITSDSQIPFTTNFPTFPGGDQVGAFYDLVNSIPSLYQAAIKDYIAVNPGGNLGGLSVTFQSAYNNDVATANASVLAYGLSYASALAQQSIAAKWLDAFVQSNPAGNDPTRFMLIYQIAASAQFTQIFPTASPTANAYSSLVGAYHSLSTQLSNLIAQGQSPSTQNTLAYFIKLVRQDISSHVINLNTTGLSASAVTALYTNAVSSYIIDNQNQKLNTTTGFKAGSIQTHVSNAISSAQSLNSQQQVDVTNYQFIFQSFYQSASDVLSKISKILENLAQSISKG